MKKEKTQLRKDYFADHSNVWLPNEVHRAIKIKAAQEGITLKEMFAKTVNFYLQNTTQPQQ